MPRFRKISREVGHVTSASYQTPQQPENEETTFSSVTNFNTILSDSPLIPKETCKASEDVTAIHLENVWREVRALETHHSSSNRFTRIRRTIEPVIDFFATFSPVFDTMTNGTASASLIWGSLKAVLVV